MSIIQEQSVENWADLLQALHAKDLIPQKAKQWDHYRSPFVFRGMSDAAWQLETSL